MQLRGPDLRRKSLRAKLQHHSRLRIAEMQLLCGRFKEIAQRGEGTRQICNLGTLSHVEYIALVVRASASNANLDAMIVAVNPRLSVEAFDFTHVMTITNRATLRTQSRIDH